MVVADSAGGRRVNRGSNLRIKVKLTLQEIANGVEKKLKQKSCHCHTRHGSGAQATMLLQHAVPAKGSGQVKACYKYHFRSDANGYYTCNVCGGEGQVIGQYPHFVMVQVLNRRR